MAKAMAAFAEGRPAKLPRRELKLPEMIEALRQLRTKKPADNQMVSLREQDLDLLITKARSVFADQPMLLELDPPMQVVGDVHGQYFDLLRILEYGGDPGQRNYLFLGDYVDRGKNSIECVSLLFAYKVLHPENFFLLRGNHECASINRIYGFFDECNRRYTVKLWKTFGDAFNWMPVCASIDDRILCMHGGLSPELEDFDQIRSIQRPANVGEVGLLVDLLWSDPNPSVELWADNDRGVSFTFGPKVLNTFLQRHNLDLVCRAHQVVEDGYEFFAGRRLVTVFSAPNYCKEFDNAGALMTIDQDLRISFHVLKPNLG
ncbi:unnamed protein product [Durusdinium trenchii]|uniref:Serine/threonine-protein phosphatase n=2 Tax=Durusdinium trenchii TaxID=1381693 RepID=A0ABP0HM51_9DINO